LNLAVPRDLRAELKVLAARRETTLRALVRRALEELVASAARTEREERPQ